jgi:uncharacterized protein (DUF2141 family)
MAIERFAFNLVDLAFGGATRQEDVSSNPDNGDEYAFLMPVGTGINISVTHDFRLRRGDADLRVFEDRDQDGRLDTGEPTVASSTQKSGANEFINFRGIGGFRYVIGVVNSRADAPRGSVVYTIRASFSDIGTANPLAGKEIQLGTISQDLTRRNTISNKDTADNFAFTLDGNSSLNINVRELGNKKGDVNIRVVQDRNSNGMVDRGEVVVRGTSSSQGNIDTITGLTRAGDYILQVCQSQGITRFAATFDHSVA